MISQVWYFFRYNRAWIHGRMILAGLVALSLIIFLLCKWCVIFVIALLAFVLFFFRLPQRGCKEYELDPGHVLICPADGRVIEMAKVDDERIRVSIFLSLVDAHVQWMPVGGIVKNIEYRPGKFLVAYGPKSSQLNERIDVVIVSDKYGEIMIRQIAGIIARRIVCWVNVGDEVYAGQPYGMIRFGSRVEVVMPKNVLVAVKKGDRVKGGESMLAVWSRESI